MKTKTIVSFNAEAELLKRIDSDAEVMGLSRSQMINKALKDYFSILEFDGVVRHVIDSRGLRYGKD